MDEFNNNITNIEYYNKYVELFNKYNELNEKLNKRKEIQKKANHKFFNNIQKHKTIFCDICDIDVKTCSYPNHIKSQKHLKCVELQNKIKDLQK